MKNTVQKKTPALTNTDLSINLNCSRKFLIFVALTREGREKEGANERRMIGLVYANLEGE